MHRCLLAFLPLLLACQSKTSAAQEQFTKEFSCPKDRVTVTPRTDLSAYELAVGERDKPPADVAADPGRLAEWNKKQKATEDGYKSFKIFSVRGCDHDALYTCTDAVTNNGEQTVACSKPAHPPAK